MTEGLNHFYTHDHERLDQLFERFQQLKGKNLPAAKVLLEEFRAGLQQHMAWEEAILFCEYDDRTRHPEESPTAELRSDHHEILAHLEAIEDKIARSDANTEAEERRFLKTLSAHNRMMSAPKVSITFKGSVVLPFDFDIFSPLASIVKPWVRTAS